MANPVVAAILGATTDAHVRAAMLMGSQLESGMNPSAVGDNGKSYGPYQIYTVAHPNVSPAQAADPGWATAFMLPAYQAGVNKVPSALWTADPAKAAATAAYYAERPKVMYPDSRIKSAWPVVSGALNGQTIGPTTGTGGVVQASDPLGIGQSVDNAVTSFRKGVMILANMSLFFAATVVGGILVLAGLIMLFRQTSARSSVSTVTSGLGKIVTLPVRGAKRSTSYWLGPKGERGYDYGRNSEGRVSPERNAENSNADSGADGGGEPSGEP